MIKKVINLDKYDQKYVSILLYGGCHVHGKLSANKTSDGPYRDTHSNGFTLEEALIYQSDESFRACSEDYFNNKESFELSSYEINSEYVSVVRALGDPDEQVD